MEWEVTLVWIEHCFDANTNQCTFHQISNLKFLLASFSCIFSVGMSALSNIIITDRPTGIFEEEKKTAKLTSGQMSKWTKSRETKGRWKRLFEINMLVQ